MRFLLMIPAAWGRVPVPVLCDAARECLTAEPPGIGLTLRPGFTIPVADIFQTLSPQSCIAPELSVLFSLL